MFKPFDVEVPSSAQWATMTRQWILWLQESRNHCWVLCS